MLKSLLNLLLSKFLKRSDTAFIANQSSPSDWGRRIMIKDDVFGNLSGTYTAPTDGYFCIVAGDKIKTIFIESRVPFRLELPTGSLSWPQVFSPVCKGDLVHYLVVITESQYEGSDVFFLPCIGSK